LGHGRVEAFAKAPWKTLGYVLTLRFCGLPDPKRRIIEEIDAESGLETRPWHDSCSNKNWWAKPNGTETPKSLKLVIEQGKALKITLGAICEGIEAKKVPARQRGRSYQVKRRHLIKYAMQLLSEKNRIRVEFGAEA